MHTIFSLKCFIQNCFLRLCDRDSKKGGPIRGYGDTGSRFEEKVRGIRDTE